jgi:isopentenyl phosphate kinase
VVFDTSRGGTILSTEEAFTHLARELKPGRILMAGIEQGVWADFPSRNQLIDCISAQNIDEITGNLKGSSAVDVTGGMVQKVFSMLNLVRSIPSLEILIFSGNEPGNVLKALLGAKIGTTIKAG